MYTKKALLLLCVILYSIDQVFCVKCYDCASDVDEECRTNPKQNKFEKVCEEKMDNGVTMKADQCAIAKATKNGKEEIIRACSFEILTDDEIKKLSKEGGGYIVNDIHRCKTDLCNSSNFLCISFWSFMGVYLLLLSKML